MGRTVTALLALVLGLSACSGSADPSPPPRTPTPTPTTSAPTTSPSPTVPVMPEAAKAHTKAGAKAFVEYFWQVVDYAQRTGDTAPLETLSNPGCNACKQGIRAIDAIYKAGGRISGGNATLNGISVDLLLAGGVYLAHVGYQIQIAAQVDDFPGTEKDRTEPGYRSHDRLDLVQAPTGWRASRLVVSK